MLDVDRRDFVEDAVPGRVRRRELLLLGLRVFGDVAHKMTNVVAVEIPGELSGDQGNAARSAMLEEFGIEIGTSFGPLAGRVWRIGTMGYNARRDAVLLTLAALEQVLRAGGVPLSAGGGVGAAREVYAGAGR